MTPGEGIKGAVMRQLTVRWLSSGIRTFDDVFDALKNTPDEATNMRVRPMGG
jgi:hypothetical protein